MPNGNGSKRLWTTITATLVVLGGGTGTVSLVGQQSNGNALDTLRNDTLPALQREMTQRDARIDATTAKCMQNAVDIASIKSDVATIKEKTEQIDTIREDQIEMKVMQEEIIRILRSNGNHGGPAPSRDDDTTGGP